MVLYYKVRVLKEDSATLFNPFIETLAVMLIFLKKDTYYVEKGRMFFSFAKQCGIFKPGFCIG